VSALSEKVVGVIPARMGSSRFPGKPLAPILGIPMVEHVRRRVAMCENLDGVYVATCDQEIYDAIESFGGEAVMTSTVHQRASDRVAEVAESMEADIFVLVQGDEPMTLPEMIDRAVAPMLEDSSIECVNLTKRIDSLDSWRDPNTIKVVTDLNGDALYFSRQPIPTDRILGTEGIPLFKQVCIIPFRRDTLLSYASLAPTPLEESESIDMMRFLEHGYRVRMVETEFDTFAVDTPEDLERVQEMMRTDELTQSYLAEALKG
jgi:3-deoxy-manno-octulosonate cytidylyltransferase (CMP-KDO synthetase)